MRTISYLLCYGNVCEMLWAGLVRRSISLQLSAGVRRGIIDFCSERSANDDKTMHLRFSANLNFLFAEGGGDLVERYRRAAAAGFRAVEHGFPVDVTTDQVLSIQRETGLQVALLNICLGDGPAFGCAAIPGMESTFLECLQKTIALAQALNCYKIHLMAGKVVGGPNDANHRTYESNLQIASEELEKAGIVGVIEPICTYGVPDYYLNNYERATDLIRRIDSPHLRLMLDVYHLQHIAGNVTYRIRDLMPLVGHVQIAQVPLRQEPHTLGELNFAYVFRVLDESEYDSWIGLEYRPLLETVHGLQQWLNKFDLSL